MSGPEPDWLLVHSLAAHLVSWDGAAELDQAMDVFFAGLVASGEAVTPKRPQRGAASASSAGGVRRIAFRLDPDLHTALTAQAAAVKTSHGHIGLDSVEAAHTNGVLADLVAEEGPDGHTEGGMFPRLVGRGPAQPTVPSRSGSMPCAVAVLDQLVQDTTAQSRTQLIVAALRHHLRSQ